MKDIKYIIGIVLVIAGILTSVLNIYFLMIGVPVFIIGAVLIFLSKASMTAKLISALAPALLGFGTLIVLVNFGKKVSYETYLIPEGFNGSFRIVYNQACGTEPKEEEGRKVFEIPANGILLVKPALTDGITESKYYVVGNNGQRTQLSWIDDTTSVVSKNGILTDGITTSNSLMYSGYCVYKAGDTKKDPTQADPRMDSLMNAAIARCK